MKWIIIETKAGKLSYCACQGDKLIREFQDIAYGIKYEEMNKFIGYSLNDFLAEGKLSFEARQRGEYFKVKIPRIPSTEFRALQKRIEKKEAERKRNGIN